MNQNTIDKWLDELMKYLPKNNASKEATRIERDNIKNNMMMYMTMKMINTLNDAQVKKLESLFRNQSEPQEVVDFINNSSRHSEEDLLHYFSEYKSEFCQGLEK